MLCCPTPTLKDIFNLVLLEAVDGDFNMPTSLDSLLGDHHPNVRRFLHATRSLDPEGWEKMHAVLEKAKRRMVERAKGRHEAASSSRHDGDGGGGGGGGGTAKL